MKFCTSCGAQNPDNNNFCRSCGQKFEALAVSPQPQPQPTPTPANYQITFLRPKNFQAGLNLFHVKVDGVSSYELKNGGSVKIPMTPGQHHIEISVFGVPRKTQFYFQATSDMTFICNYNMLASLLLLSTPVKVTDANGKEYN